MEILDHEIDRRATGRFDPQRTAHAEHIAIVDLGVVEQVLGIAVTVEIEPGHADSGNVADRHVDHALRLHAVVIAVFAFDAGFGHAKLGPLGAEVDHARGGIAAKQGALRTAQDFDLAHVVEFTFEQARAEQRRVVHVNGRGAVAGRAHAEIADPADGEARAGEVAFGEGNVGQGQLKIGGVLDLLLFERFGVEGTDGNRHVLQFLIGALCGHHDIGGFRLIGGRRSLCVNRKCNRSGAYARKQSKFTPHQPSLL